MVTVDILREIKDLKKSLTSKEALPVYANLAKLGGAALGGTTLILAETKDALNQFPLFPTLHTLAEQHPTAFLVSALAFAGLAVWGFFGLASTIEEYRMPDVSARALGSAARRGLNRRINAFRRNRQ